jgi:hypothetical protein
MTNILINFTLSPSLDSGRLDALLAQLGRSLFVFCDSYSKSLSFVNQNILDMFVSASVVLNSESLKSAFNLRRQLNSENLKEDSENKKNVDAIREANLKAISNTAVRERELKIFEAEKSRYLNQCNITNKMALHKCRANWNISNLLIIQ